MTHEQALTLPRGTLLKVASLTPPAIVELVKVEEDTVLVTFIHKHRGYVPGNPGQYCPWELELVK